MVSAVIYKGGFLKLLHKKAVNNSKSTYTYTYIYDQYDQYDQKKGVLGFGWTPGQAGKGG